MKGSSFEWEQIYIEQEHRGAGVGSALMERCPGSAANSGGELTRLEAWRRKSQAIAFYRRWKFEEVPRVNFVLGRTVESDLLMVRTLDSGARADVSV